MKLSARRARTSIGPTLGYSCPRGSWGAKAPPSSWALTRDCSSLAASSFGAVHTIRGNGSCVKRARSATTACVHGRSMSCARRHVDNHADLGRPLCEKCFDYRGAVLWNAHASRLWNNTIQLVRRLLAEEGGIAQPNLRSVAQLHYLKVAEVQRRGLAHFHCVLRLDGPESIDADPPVWATAELLERVVRSSIERGWAPDLDDRPVRWGRVYDIQDLALREEEAVKVAAYVAKYSAKTTDGSKELARRFRSRRQIASLVDDLHLRCLALTARDLGGEAKYESLRLRDHAHTFGFTGQLITKSRQYRRFVWARRGWYWRSCRCLCG